MNDVIRRSRTVGFRVPRIMAWGVVMMVCVALLWGVTAFAQVAPAAVVPSPASGTVPDYLQIIMNGGVGLYGIQRIESAMREASMIGRDVVRALERSVQVGGDRADNLESALKGLPPQIERLTNAISNARAA